MKTKRIIFFDLSLWNSFIRKLLYPAILGSLIYDLTRFDVNNEFYLMIITIIFYIIDDLYMTYVLEDYGPKIEGNNKLLKPHMVFIDFLVAVLFMLIIYSIHKTSYYVVLSCTLAIFILALLYFENTRVSLTIFLLLITSSILLIVLEILMVSYCKCNINEVTDWIYSLMVFFYIVAISTDYYIDKKNI